MGIARLITVLVVASMHSRPEEDRSLNTHGAEDGEDDLYRCFGLEGAVREVPVEAHFDPDYVHDEHTDEDRHLHDADATSPEQSDRSYDPQKGDDDRGQGDTPLQLSCVGTRRRYSQGIR